MSERKVTSVLFGDLVAFTTLSEQRDKEDVRDLLSQYFAQCRRIVQRYGGTIEKFIGDAVMAVWGVPVAHEDDAERAVRSGLELVRAIETLGEELGLPALAMRVGIVTGEVAVTLGAQHEGMVAGDAVNTAARVQSVASSGQVWVDETTRLRTSGAITYIEVGSHELKGKAEPVPLWAVRAVVAAVGGAQRADGLEAPLVGRGRELRVIKELFHGVEESSRPALVLVSGDPGLGKSRLAWEFFKYIDGLSRGVSWHSTRCLAYGEGVAFWPIAEAVRGRLGLVESDADADPAAALDVWMASRLRDESEIAWLRARVLALLGRVASGGFDRDDLFAAWQTFFEHAGDGDPVALVIDDAEHADEGTVAFVEHLLANSGSPLFILLLSRPELLQRWPDLATNRRATVLHLAPLDTREMSALLDGLVSGLPEHVQNGLADRAQGVPLYAIETVRSLIDRDLVVPRGGIYVLPDPSAVDVAAIGAPASLQALVAARLDGLPAAERRVVDDASVLGATFTRDAIAAIATDVPDLDDVLNALTRAEILGAVTSRLSAEYGQYRFVQDVVRQVAYNTQARRDRKSRHLAVAAYFETLPDPGGDYAPVLAQHYLDALDSSPETGDDLDDLHQKAVGYLARAAARARALGVAGDALRYLETALRNSTDDSAAALHLQAAWAAFDIADADNAEAHAGTAMDRFDATGDRLGVAEAAAVLGLVHMALKSENAAALDVARPHWEALQGVRGAEHVLLHLCRVIIGASMRMNLDVTDVALARVAIADSIGDRPALADALLQLGGLFLGRTPSLLEILAGAAADIARESQRPRMASKALMTTSLVTAPNDLAASWEQVEAAFEQAARSGADAYESAVAAVNVTTRALVRGALDRAEQMLDAASPITDMRFVLPWLDAMLADMSGQPRRHPSLPPEMRATDDETLIAVLAATDMYEARAAGDRHAATGHGTDAVARMLAVVGLSDDMIFIWPAAVECALAEPDRAVVEHLLAAVDDALPGLVGRGYRAHRLRFAGLLAMHDGVTTDVEQNLRAAITAFEEWGSPPYAAKARAELAGWLDGQHRADEAASLRQEARAVLQAMAANGWLAELGLEQAPAVTSTG